MTQSSSAMSIAMPRAARAAATLPWLALRGRRARLAWFAGLYGGSLLSFFLIVLTVRWLLTLP